MSDQPRKQRVWPLFAVAMLLMAWGLYLAGLGAQPATDGGATELPEPFLVPLPSVQPETADVVYELRAATAPATYRIDLRQEQRRGEQSMRTRMALRVVDSEAAVKGDERDFSRRYEDVELTLADSEGAVAAPIVADVERLIATATHHVRTRSTGEPIDVSLTSAEATQLRQALRLIEQALLLLAPRLPREPVRGGEVWSWSLPAGDGDAASTAASGNTDVSARVLGTVNGNIVLAMELQGSSAVDLNDMSGRPLNMKAAGRGAGVAVWSPGTGRLLSSDLHWEQTAEVDAVTVVTESRFSLTSE